MSIQQQSSGIRRAVLSVVPKREGLRVLLSIVVVCLVVCSPGEIPPRPSPVTHPLCSAVDSVSTVISCMFSLDVPPDVFARLWAAAVEIQAAGDAPPARARALVNLLYNDWEMQFDPTDTDVRNMLPYTCLVRKKGGCVGVGLLFLMLGELIDIPLHGVLLPGHFFVRYDDGDTVFNIEPNRNGYSHPDSYYRTRYPVDSMTWHSMESLPVTEIPAILWYNGANAAVAAGTRDIALSWYRNALALRPGWVEAWGNYAHACEQAGMVTEAARAYRNIRLHAGWYPRAVKAYIRFARRQGDLLLADTLSDSLEHRHPSVIRADGVRRERRAP